MTAWTQKAKVKTLFSGCYGLNVLVT